MATNMQLAPDGTIIVNGKDVGNYTLNADGSARLRLYEIDEIIQPLKFVGLLTRVVFEHGIREQSQS
ncbi:MAG: hypothetical protein ACLQKK_09685 [Rhodomicrobium sp.]